MNVLNRLLGLLLLLLVLAAALATIGLVTDLLTVPDVRRVWAYGPVVTITHDVGHLGTDRWPWVLGGAIVAGLIALILLVRELTPPRRQASWRNAVRGRSAASSVCARGWNCGAGLCWCAAGRWSAPTWTWRQPDRSCSARLRSV